MIKCCGELPEMKTSKANLYYLECKVCGVKTAYCCDEQTAENYWCNMMQFPYTGLVRRDIQQNRDAYFEEKNMNLFEKVLSGLVLLAIASIIFFSLIL